MAGDDVRELLRRHQLRVTPQRRAILEAFHGARDEHLSAEEVMSRASTTVPDIGRGTVYASLAELTELGLLASVGDTEPIRYETNLSLHDHFRCRLCLRMFDVDLGGSRLRNRKLDGFAIDSLAVNAEGICTDCNAYQRGLVDGARAALDEQVLSSVAIAGLACGHVDSPIGDILVVASPEGIVRLAFEDHADYDLLNACARSRRGPVSAREHLRTLNGNFGRYFAGSRERFADAIDWRLTDGDGHRVLAAAQEIPYNGQGSYDRLAGDVDAYEVGRLMGSNPWPVLIPCHRVSCGSLRPENWVGGAERLRLLHELEAG